MTTHSEPSFACDLTRLPATDRQRLVDDARRLFAQATQVTMLPDGYAIGFAQASPDLIAKIADFIALDRLCCGFLRHELASEPHDATIWLRLTGAPGVKAFIRADLFGLLPAHISDQLAGSPGHQCRGPRGS